MVTGPLHATAPEVFAALRDAGAVAVAESAEALPQRVTELLGNPAERLRLSLAATAVLQASRGSLGQIVAWAAAARWRRSTCSRTATGGLPT